jgi:hypothetical protein
LRRGLTEVNLGCEIRGLGREELLSFGQWLAAALIIAASTGSTLTSRRPAPVVAGEGGEGWQGDDRALTCAMFLTQFKKIAELWLGNGFRGKGVIVDCKPGAGGFLCRKR